MAQAVPWHAWHQSGNVKTLCTAVLGTHAQWQVTPSAGMPSLPTTPTLLCELTAARDYCSQRSDSQLCNARVVVYLPGNWLKSLGSALLYLCRPLVLITGKTAIYPKPSTTSIKRSDSQLCNARVVVLSTWPAPPGTDKQVGKNTANSIHEHLTQ